VKERERERDKGMDTKSYDVIRIREIFYEREKDKNEADGFSGPKACPPFLIF
jgi:hypothetical protein